MVFGHSYDERSLYPNQNFFPESDSKRDWSRLAKALNGELCEDLLDKFSGVESLPFPSGDNKKIAVKIIDNRGIESFVIKSWSKIMTKINNPHSDLLADILTIPRKPDVRI